MYSLSEKSQKALVGVHPDLVSLIERVMQKQVVDFSVHEGLRDLTTQKVYLANGVSKTLKSKHLKQPDGFGHAVDLYPYPIDLVAVNKGDVREIVKFGVLAGVMLSTAKELGIGLTWGGYWKSPFDCPHFELTEK